MTYDISARHPCLNHTHQQGSTPAGGARSVDTTVAPPAKSCYRVTVMADEITGQGVCCGG